MHATLGHPGLATQGPSNPNSLDAEVPAARAEPVDATVARGVVAAAGDALAGVVDAGFTVWRVAV